MFGAVYFGQTEFAAEPLYAPPPPPPAREDSFCGWALETTLRYIGGSWYD